MSRIRRTFTYEGKRYYAEGNTVEEAVRNRDILKYELEHGKKTIDRDMRVSDWCDEYLETYKRDKINDRYFSDLKGVLNRYIVNDLGFMKLSSIKPIHLQKALNTASGLSVSTIRKVYQAIKGMFYTAYINDLILDDITKALTLPTGKPKGERRAITEQERQLTLTAAEKTRGGLFILIMLYCGLRPGEVAALKWNNIDLQKKLIHVVESVKSDNTVGPPKSKSGIRDVPIPEVLCVKLSKINHEPFDLVCTNSFGHRYAKRSITDMWAQFKKAMEEELNKDLKDSSIHRTLADDLTLYCYRHTYCTDLQAAGVPINVAKELMGHASISITAQIYTHRSEKALENAAKLINTLNDVRVV